MRKNETILKIVKNRYYAKAIAFGKRFTLGQKLKLQKCYGKPTLEVQ